MNKNNPQALILAGGLGTRLRAVDQGLPKVMVPVCGEPFLFWLVKSLELKGFTQIIFSTGYRSQFVEDFPWSKKFPQISFQFIKEETPLGTGGAVKNVFALMPELERAWVINGDTLLENGPNVDQYVSSDAVTYSALEKNSVFDAEPNLLVSGDRVIDVNGGEGSYFDAGQVFISREAALAYSGTVPCSFHQLISESLKAKKVGFCIVSGHCYDIGTPDRLLRFEKYLKDVIL